MKFLGLLILCLLGTESFAQNYERLPGTKLLLDLPSDFITDRKLPGFKSIADKSNIRVQQMDLAITFEEWKKKGIDRLLLNGFDTLNTISTTYNGYESLQFFHIHPITNEETFVLTFGNDDFQVNIAAVYTPERKREIIDIIFDGVYDESIIIDPLAILGFSADHSKSTLKVSGLSAVSIKYEERNSSNEIISYLGLTRTEKNIFESLTLEEAIEFISLQYFSASIELSEENHLIANQPAITRLFKTNRGTYDEFNVLTIIYTDDFDIIAVGGVNLEIKLSMIKEVIQSIKIN
jgi:hypothetical protein